MEAIKFITWYNFVPSPGEVNKEASLTVPDMSYSIRELLENFVRMPEIAKPAIWQDDPDIDSPRGMASDLTDLTENANRIQSLTEELNAVKTALMTNEPASAK